MGKYFILAASMLLFASCKQDKSAEEGQKLAKTYCVSCHSFPEPDLLDKNSWEKYMLPRMGVFLGVTEHDSLRNVMVSNEAERQIADASGVFPKQQVVTDEEWQKIKAFSIHDPNDEHKMHGGHCPSAPLVANLY